jgi:dienelactone hydrolase
MWTRRKRWLAGIAAGAGAAAAWAGWRMLTTAVLLLDLSGQQTRLGQIVPVSRAPVQISALEIPTRHGSVTARLYTPAVESPPSIVVFPGVHGGGIDEPRLAGFSTRFAASGINVLSVPLPELRAFRITARSTDIIEDVALWASANPRLAPHGRIGLAGVSFAGGLALVAAGRPSLVNRLDVVISLGGHGDLGRVLRYLSTGVLPDGTIRPPHDYGVTLMALAAARSLVPGQQADRLEQAILTYLEASTDDTAEQRRAMALLAEARHAGLEMAEPARSIMNAVTTHDVAALGRALQPFVDELAGDPALSPERSPAARAPVFLLQGLADNVIPPSETPRVAEYLSRSGNQHVRWLVTPALSHVGLEREVGWLDWWRLIRFWQALGEAI